LKDKVQPTFVKERRAMKVTMIPQICLWWWVALNTCGDCKDSLFGISDTIDFLELMVDHMDDLPMCAEGVRGV
jgi:hypothetical protein